MMLRFCHVQFVFRWDRSVRNATVNVGVGSCLVTDPSSLVVGLRGPGWKWPRDELNWLVEAAKAFLHTEQWREGGGLILSRKACGVVLHMRPGLLDRGVWKSQEKSGCTK